MMNYFDSSIVNILNSVNSIYIFYLLLYENEIIKNHSSYSQREIASLFILVHVSCLGKISELIEQQLVDFQIIILILARIIITIWITCELMSCLL